MDKDKMMPLTSGTVSLVPTLHFSTVQFISKNIDGQQSTASAERILQNHRE